MFKFSETELNDIYRNIVKKNSEYLLKYKRLPSCPVKGWNYSWKGKGISRDFAILDFIEWVKKHNIQSGNKLGSTYTADPELEFINYNTTIDISYPKVDLHIMYHELHNMFDFLYLIKL